MHETPNDSGESPVDSLNERGRREPFLVYHPLTPAAAEPPRPAESRWGETGIHRLSGAQLRAELRRPAVWGLLLLIVVVLAVQIWLLFL